MEPVPRPWLPSLLCVPPDPVQNRRGQPARHRLDVPHGTLSAEPRLDISRIHLDSSGLDSLPYGRGSEGRKAFLSPDRKGVGFTGPA